MPAARIPVIALTGHLGAGQTTVLNQLLSAPGARLGVIINDFGAIDVDTALVTGQIDEAASIAGGCLCCLSDTDDLDDALERLTHPRLRLDAVVIEASGVAEPRSLAQLVRFSGAERARPGGVIDVVDAVEHFRTVDIARMPPARYAACSLVIVNKVDRLPPAEREETVARIVARIREVNPDVHVVTASQGRIDPALVFDVAAEEEPPDELPLAALARETAPAPAHRHAHAVSVPAPEPIDPGRLVDLLEAPPEGVYRMKGIVRVDTGRARRAYVVHLVGRQIHVSPHSAGPGATPGLVAIGAEFDEDAVRARLDRALRPADGDSIAPGLRRLQRYRRLSA